MNNYCTNGGCRSCPPANCCDCPCGKDLHRALGLLCCAQLQPLINFDAFAFVSGYYILGSATTTLTVGTAPSDNLDAPAGSYVCGGNSCSTASVSGAVYSPAGTAATGSTVSLASLCAATAVAFDAAPATATATQAENFQAARQLLSQLLRPQPHPSDCCTEGSLLNSLTTAAQQTVSLAAGPLLLENAAVLGELGSVLVLANSTDFRFYLVCANKIDFIG